MTGLFTRRGALSLSGLLLAIALVAGSTVRATTADEGWIIERFAIRYDIQRDGSIVVVAAPAGSVQRVDCFQGVAGSTERCHSRFTPDSAVFTATRLLDEGE